MSKKTVRDMLIEGGVEEDQADLITKAIELARQRQDRGRLVFETPALRSVRRSFYATSDTTGRDYRSYQEIVTQELKRLSPHEVAFGDMSDEVREQYSAFCWTMYKGHQERYLDRHEDEDPVEFLNRQQKRTLNLTKLVINVLSKLYHKPPAREHKTEQGEGAPETVPGMEPTVAPEPPEVFVAPEHVRERLDEIWSGELFNRSMQEIDRRTRLVGTVAVRPMYDPTQPGGIRLWLFMSHQLRVIPDPARPWQPAAVVERVHPFGRHEDRSITIWTNQWFVDMRERGRVTVERHKLGRIPHVFCRDELSYDSFFVEGRGRILCNPNAILNNDLTDFEEVKKMQGFSLLELINPATDQQRVGPRETVVFKPGDNQAPYGANFRAPNAPLAELRADLRDQIDQILETNNVPAAALGAEINRRTLSGAAIRAAMQPIVSDNKEREALFKPIEHDLADSMLRIVDRHENGFAYNADAERPEFAIFYQPMEFPLDVRDQVVKDDFDIAQGINTPAGVMRRDDPELYQTHEDAVKAWQENLDELRNSGFTPGEDDPTDLQASYGGFQPTVEGRDPLNDYDAGDLLDDFLNDSEKALLRDTPQSSNQVPVTQE